MKFLKISKIDFLAIFFLFLINYLLKIPLTANGFFAFTYDQGRDFLEVAKIIYQGDLTLIGPTTGLPGIFYGPWWYYFLSPILYVADGDPQKVAIFFGFLGIVTIIAIYLLLKFLTKDTFVSMTLSLVASMSRFYLFGPTLIWSPSLVPLLMVLLFCVVYRIFNQSKPIFYFLLGIIVFLIEDSGAAFGIVLSISLLISPVIFRKTFLKKEFLLTIFGGILVLLPRIIFELKHNFLMISAIFSYFTRPKVYGEEMLFIPKILARLDLFWGTFSASFTRNNKLVGIILIFFLLTLFWIIIKNKNYWSKFTRDGMFSYSSMLILIFFICFLIFPDRVWDYYLVGLPIIFVVLMAKIFAHTIKIHNLSLITKLLLIFLVLFNFHENLLAPFKISWLGDGAIYRNQKLVMDYIVSQRPHNYSFYTFSPAIFDYPFDYLINWYSRQNLIEKPADHQRLMYLIIRDDNYHTYLQWGWYGDKTKDKSQIIERKEFPGSLIVEKHLRND